MNGRILRNLLITGALLAVLAAVPYNKFDLARFTAPKELVVSLFWFLLAFAGLRRAERLALDRADLLVLLYLLLTCASALFARNYWLAASAVSVTFAGAAAFWAARRAAKDGFADAVIAGVAAAAVMSAAASLAQAYGLQCDLFSPYRIPGGTMGNRNFMAHLAAICAPALVLAAARARSRSGTFAGALGLALVAAALVLSRTRAAWLGIGAGTAVLAYGVWYARGRLSGLVAARRAVLLGAAVCFGVLAALFVPNKLEWKSDSPYLDTVTGIANYQTGSGHGRLVQYRRTLRMAAAHPLLGTGPGSWQFVYPEFSEYFDPSMDYSTGLPMNPWPSSDWLAILSERGLMAFIIFSLLLLTLLRGAWRNLSLAAEADGCFRAIALAATIAVAVVVGCFDAVLMMPAPSFIMWAALGALTPALPEVRVVALSSEKRRTLLIAVSVLGFAAVLRGATQVAAMAIANRARGLSRVTLAARLDPSNTRIRQRLESMHGAIR